VTVSLGRALATTTLYLTEESAFADTVERSTPWVDPPVIEFGDGAATWTAVIDAQNPNVAVFTEPRTAVALRSAKEAWRLRDVTTDEVLAKGRVEVQATS
jgi:hypothetical protein